jgi:hypothetical protein
MRGRYRVNQGQRDPRGMIVPGVPADERMERVPVWRQRPAFLGGGRSCHVPREMAAGLAREDPDEPLHVVRYRTVMGRVPARDMAVTAMLRCADSPFPAGSGEPGSGKEVDLPQFPVVPSRKSERFLYQPEPNGMVQMQRNKRQSCLLRLQRRNLFPW